MTTNSKPVVLTHFTQPAVLESVGQVRLAKFLHAFKPDLEAATSGLLPLLLSSSPDLDAIASEFASIPYGVKPRTIRGMSVQTPAIDSAPRRGERFSLSWGRGLG